MASWLDDAKEVKAAPGWLAEAKPVDLPRPGRGDLLLAESQRDPGRAASFVEHAANGLAVNELPRLMAAGAAGSADRGARLGESGPLQTAADVVRGLLGAQDRGAGPGLAAAAEGEARDRLRAGTTHHPGYAFAGEAVGGAAPGGLIADAVPAVKGTRLLPRLLNSTRQGAAIGAAYGLGEENPGEGAARGAGVGGAAGFTIPLLMEGAGRVARPVARYLSDKAEEWGRKVLTGGAQTIGPTKKQLSAEAVRAGYDQGAILPLGTTAGAAERLGVAREKIGGHYADILARLEAQGVHGPEAEALANEIAAKAAQTQQNTLGSPVPEFLQARAEELRSKALPISGRGRLGLMQTELMKRGLQRDAQNDFAREGGLSQSGEARMGLASDVRGAIENAVDEQAGRATGVPTPAAAEFEPVKEQLSHVIEAETAARKAAARMSQHKHHSLTDTITKGAVLSHGGPAAIPEALAAGEASRAARLRGPSTFGWLANSGATALGSLPQTPVSPLIPALETATPNELRSWLAEAMRRKGLPPGLAPIPTTASSDDRQP